MKALDLRASLAAIAAGKRQPQPENVLDADLVERGQRAFRAWARFAAPAHGEPLTAPGELLTLLP